MSHPALGKRKEKTYKKAKKKSLFLPNFPVNMFRFLRTAVCKVHSQGKNIFTPRINPTQPLFTAFPACAAEVTKPAPDFKGTAVIGNQFKEIKLSDYSGKYVVLFFYPLDFTFVCPTEIVAFSDRSAEFKAINTEVIAASTDSHFSHLAWINTPRKKGGLGAMNIPLLSDYNKNISKDYGVLLDAPGIALRGLFIIDPKGIVRHITINDLPIGRSVDEALRVVKALQFVEKHGEVCPAGWQPDSPTIKPDPVKASEYFEKVN